MNEKPRKERSPNCPKMSLLEALEVVKDWHAKAATTKLKLEVVAGIIGYSGLNGAALTVLGALTQYRLIERHTDGTASVSQVSVQLMHPTSNEQKLRTLKECALAPKVFADLIAGGFHKASRDIICNELIQRGFASDIAEKVADAFLANVELAKLSEGDIVKQEPDKGIFHRPTARLLSALLFLTCSPPRKKLSLMRRNETKKPCLQLT